MTRPSRADRLALALFVTTVLVAVFGYGVAVGRYQLFPFGIIQRIHAELTLALSEPGFAFLRRVEDRSPEPLFNTPRAYPGLNLVTKFVSDTEFLAEIVDMDGSLVHRWTISWFDLWPDADHLPEREVPRALPGTQIHGAVVVDDGDLVFNFDNKGLIRIDAEGEVVWRLPYATHHSVVRAASGNLWVPGMLYHEESDDRFPQRAPPFVEHTALEVSPDGVILHEWSIAEILEENGLHGLLFLGTTRNSDTRVGNADLLHLNDVEPFPDWMEEGFFKRGDIMVSLRNINTVLVFNRHTRQVRFVADGWFVRQHDADFLDGNRFSVYDNNNVGPEANGHQSRIVVVDAASNSSSIYFEGNPEIPFYSDILGKHQWLPNGNLLITEPMRGRALEVDERRELTWEYINYVEPGIAGVVQEVQRIPTEYRALYESNRR